MGLAGLGFILVFLFALLRVHLGYREHLRAHRRRDEAIAKKLKPPDNVVPITKKLVTDIIDLEIERRINQ